MLTVSGLVDKMSETCNKSTHQAKSCEHQPSLSVRVLIYFIAAMLLAHMIVSAFLYVFFSMKLNQKYPGQEGKTDMHKGDWPGLPTKGRNTVHHAAHLIAWPPTKKTAHENGPGNNFPCEKGSPIKQWSTGYPAFTRNMNYTSGKLVITKPGLYYVYCQVSFRLTSEKNSDGKTIVPFVQYIYMQRMADLSTLLMKASKTPLDTSKRSSFNSVNQGGVFQLKRGDQLFVSVTEPKVVSNDEATYFGIFEL
ncbi:tumor necrosis factor ligand superfamily member 10 [Callorhinchus milii]|uniref:CD40 ligand n=1 Tax=Callorhinchus milii TaxID=7868 RepID=V9L0T0_CALMI|nr:CD40 ligand [Callorhinchus milii]|eukprot:gi/632935683/ref/XP_007890910.1/ PREDICTED: tumor necrosis factor ligand superfamily member 10-like [Callorhinchus milii]